MSSEWISIYIRGYLVSFIEFSENYVNNIKNFEDKFFKLTS
jgi:hypothetical protein